MKIVLGFGVNDSQRALLAEAAGGAEILQFGRPPQPIFRFPDQMVGALADCDAMACYAVPQNLPELAPRLKLVQMMFAGADLALRDPATARSAIPITTVSGLHAETIGEYVLMTILAYSHRLHVCLRAQARHEWIPVQNFTDRSPTIRGKTLGVVGYGSIGREAARQAKLMGMEVLALKRNPEDHRDRGWCMLGAGDPDGSIPRAWFGPEARREMLAASDFILMTLPSTSATRNFLSTQEFKAVKPGAYLINIGRGDVIDQPALIEALKNGPLGGAGLDVMVPEPLNADSALWDLDNVLLTPHMSGAAAGYMDRACAIFSENLRRLREGREFVNVVDRQAGY